LLVERPNRGNEKGCFMNGSASATWLHEKYSVCLGITPWKRANFLQFVGGAERAEFMPLAAWREAVAEAKARSGRVICWSSSVPEGLEDMCLSEAVEFVQVEDGFIRSQGLGIKLHLPASLCFSRKGIHYDARTPSELEERLQRTDLENWQVAEGARLLDILRREKISKYNVAGQDFTWPAVTGAKQRRILVIGQVEDDASMLTGSPELRSNSELLARVRAANPDASIVYRPHPDVTSGLRKGRVAQKVADVLADAVSYKENIVSLLQACDEVHVITSQTGLEALVLEKTVVCHGQPFYAGYGLTRDLLPNERRSRDRSLEEVLYIAYVDYPAYIDPITGAPSDVFSTIALLKSGVRWPRAPRSYAVAVWARRKSRILGNIVKRFI
jgi:capsular polysaccharide export protein